MKSCSKNSVVSVIKNDIHTSGTATISSFGSGYGTTMCRQRVRKIVERNVKHDMSSSQVCNFDREDDKLDKCIPPKKSSYASKALVAQWRANNPEADFPGGV
jgi:hypothetical protein